MAAYGYVGNWNRHSGETVSSNGGVEALERREAIGESDKQVRTTARSRGILTDLGLELYLHIILGFEVHPRVQCHELPC